MASIMDQIILAHRASRGGGVIDRLRGNQLEADRRTAFHEALAAHEQAVRNGDEIAAELADQRLGRLLDEARAAHQPGPTPEAPAPRTSFDGGVRRSVVPTGQSPDMNAVIGRKLRATRALRELAEHD